MNIAIKISKECPKELYAKIKKVLNVDWNKGIAIAYKDTIYSKNDISPDLKAHEEVHIEQQNDPVNINPNVWWERYLTDVDFRMEQEIEAYKAQVYFIRTHPHLGTRMYRNLAIKNMAKYLSNGFYGFKMDFNKALLIIKN